MTAPIPRGKFVWYDLLSSDPGAAMAFYKAVAGWETQRFEDAGMDHPYTMWTVGQQPIGGVMRMGDDLAKAGVPPHWIAYVSTPDVDATTAQAKSLGGTVHHEPTDIPTVGRFSVIQDPQGAVVALFTPLERLPGHDGDAAIGEFAWHELMTSDANAAFDFYSALFGWEKTEAMDMGEMGVYQMYGQNGKTYGGMFRVPSGPPPVWCYYIRVDNADAAAKRITEHGGTICNGPMDVPGGGRIAQCLDPQKAYFAVYSMPTA